jgi:hypothetical protein
MTFPFSITPEIQAAYQAHIDYISAGEAWLLKNDPDAYNEQVLLEHIQTSIENAAYEHFGDDDDLVCEFLDEFEVQEYQGVWYELLESELEAAE